MLIHIWRIIILGLPVSWWRGELFAELSLWGIMSIHCSYGGIKGWLLHHVIPWFHASRFCLAFSYAGILFLVVPYYWQLDPGKICTRLSFGKACCWVKYKISLWARSSIKSHSGLGHSALWIGLRSTWRFETKLARLDQVGWAWFVGSISEFLEHHLSYFPFLS